jgi:hypothetical protein
VDKLAEHYIGDGVYLGFDGYHAILTTGDPDNVANRIYLSPQVWETLQFMIENTDVCDD